MTDAEFFEFLAALVPGESLVTVETLTRLATMAGEDPASYFVVCERVVDVYRPSEDQFLTWLIAAGG